MLSRLRSGVTSSHGCPAWSCWRMLLDKAHQQHMQPAVGCQKLLVLKGDLYSLQGVTSSALGAQVVQLAAFHDSSLGWGPL